MDGAAAEAPEAPEGGTVVDDVVVPILAGDCLGDDPSATLDDIDIRGPPAAAAAVALPLLLLVVVAPLLRVLAAPRMTLMGISRTFSLNVSLLKGDEDSPVVDEEEEAPPPPRGDEEDISDGDIRADPTFIGEEARLPRPPPPPRPPTPPTPPNVEPRMNIHHNC